MLPKEFEYIPSIFAVGEKYIFCVCAKCEATVWVQIGEEKYYDASNGILHSKSFFHKIEVPQFVLDDKKQYSVYLREYTNRKPYFPEYNDVVLFSNSFIPIKDNAEKIKLLHISDVHGKPEKPMASTDDDYDVLILNGDIADHSGKIEIFKTLYKIAGEVTRGKKPCIFSRGNHDLRGQYAEVLSDYTPTDNGKSYFTFHLGSLWGIVLDCGEDKKDEHSEYGNTIVCHDFRLCETQYIENIVKNAQKEYKNKKIKHKVLISHIPFSKKNKEPFDIEEEIYSKWLCIIKDEIKPNIWLAGHTHKAEIIPEEEGTDKLFAPCKVVIASEPRFDKDYNMTEFISSRVTLKENAEDEIEFLTSEK